jgi:hypothetical protein
MQKDRLLKVDRYSIRSVILPLHISTIHLGLELSVGARIFTAQAAWITNLKCNLVVGIHSRLAWVAAVPTAYDHFC